MLLKVHSRCNLSCDYCYVYQHVDQSWRGQPAVMPPAVVEAAAHRLAEHARAWGLSRVIVTFHGGEPLLAGVDYFEDAIGTIRRAIPSDVALILTVQTNGVLLDESFLELFRRHRVRVGVSLDGGPQANDLNRRYAHGGGSYLAVEAGLERLRQKRFRHLFGGLLCTVDLRNDPITVYNGLLRFAPPRMDLLLPHGNWSAPPPGLDHGRDDTPYAQWLIEIFDKWYATPTRPTDVRIFTAIMSLLLGGPGRSESVGLDPVDFVVVATDGGIEHGDALKTTADGASATGLHVDGASFDDVLRLPETRARQSGLSSLGARCQRCHLVNVCGGGHYAHRYDGRTGFDNASVYCADLQRLITHVYLRMRDDLRRRIDSVPTHRRTPEVVG